SAAACGSAFVASNAKPQAAHESEPPGGEAHDPASDRVAVARLGGKSAADRASAVPRRSPAGCGKGGADAGKLSNLCMNSGSKSYHIVRGSNQLAAAQIVLQKSAQGHARRCGTAQ